MVLVRDLSKSCSFKEYVFLEDFGIIPDVSSDELFAGADGWNTMNFTIDTRKEHLLPEPIPSLFNPCDNTDDKRLLMDDYW